MSDVVTLRPKTLGPNCARIDDVPEDEAPTVALCHQPVDPTMFWRCGCECEVFYVTPDGIICPSCGNYTSDPYEDQR